MARPNGSGTLHLAVEILDPRSLTIECDDEVTAMGGDADDRIQAALSALRNQNRREGRSSLPTPDDRANRT